VLEALRVLREEAARRDEHAQAPRRALTPHPLPTLTLTLALARTRTRTRTLTRTRTRTLTRTPTPTLTPTLTLALSLTQALRQWESRGAAAAALGGSTELAQGPGKPPALVTNLLLLGLSEGAYLLKALGLVRAAELEQALLLLPYGAACELLQRLLPLLEEAPPAELMTRCVLFVLKVRHYPYALSLPLSPRLSLSLSLRLSLAQTLIITPTLTLSLSLSLSLTLSLSLSLTPNQVHHKQLVANAAMAAPLHRLDAALHGRLRRERTVLGYNFAALRMLKQVVEERDATSLFDDALTAKDAKEVASTAERQRATVARQGKAGGGKPGGNPKKKRRAAESGGNPKPV
jgi:hypothetical protein